MNTARFDHLTKSLTARLPRRRLPGLLASLGLSLELGTSPSVADEAAAKDDGGVRGQGRGNGKGSGTGKGGGRGKGKGKGGGKGKGQGKGKGEQSPCQCPPPPPPPPPTPAGCPEYHALVAGRCARVCDAPCFATCGCSRTFDRAAELCAALGGGCSSLTTPCSGHADCAPNELCIGTTCGPNGDPANFCQRLCGQ